MREINTVVLLISCFLKVLSILGKPQKADNLDSNEIEL